jgi:uroporphyrin-III C-methyltransferase
VSFAADLEVRGRQVVVGGGHPAGLALISDLLAEGAEVTVVARSVATTIRDLAERGIIRWQDRELAADDLYQAALVVAATGTAEGDADVRSAAAAASRVVISAPTTGVASIAVAGRVVLVGGGPGDPGLITVAGLEAVRRADVVICDRLAPLAVLRAARADAEIIDVAKIPRGQFTSQEQINFLLVEHAGRGRVVVRLKGGDSFVFGRGGEEWQACTAAGVAVEVIPGVSSALAAPSLAGIPLTHRELTQGFTVVSGHLPPGDPGCTLDWPALARANTTLVIMMGVATLPAITTELLAQGMAGSIPAATVADAGLPSQRSVRGALADIAAATVAAGIRPPAVTVIGAVAGFDPHGG